MDETANQMSDVREELADVMQRAYTDATNGLPFSGAIKYPVADAILARFEVTPKPVVTAEELGQMVAEARKEGRPFAADQGKAMFRQLEAAGLMIVRTDGHR